MQLSLPRHLLLCCLLLLSSSCLTLRAAAGGWSTSSKTQLAVYFGQDDPQGGSTGPENLQKICADPAYSVVILAFLYQIGGPSSPTLNMAGNCYGSFASAGFPTVINCTQMGAVVTQCQQQYSKTVMLSLGGAVGLYGFWSAADAISRAGQVWRGYLGGSPLSTEPPRPFGSAVFDGLDLDLESQQGLTGWGVSRGYNITYWNNFTATLRANAAAAGLRFFLSGAPQCPFPDATMGPDNADNPAPTVLSHSAFDWLQLQFYNNDNNCNVFSSSSFAASWPKWANWAAAGGNPNPDLKILVGLLASSASSSYASPSVLQSVLSIAEPSPQFEGAMIWDAGLVNQSGNVYQTQVEQVLVALSVSSSTAGARPLSSSSVFSSAAKHVSSSAKKKHGAVSSSSAAAIHPVSSSSSSAGKKTKKKKHVSSSSAAAAAHLSSSSSRPAAVSSSASSTSSSDPCNVSPSQQYLVDPSNPCLCFPYGQWVCPEECGLQFATCGYFHNTSYSSVSYSNPPGLVCWEGQARNTSRPDQACPPSGTR